MRFHDFWNTWLGDPRRVFGAHLQSASWKQLLAGAQPITGAVPGCKFEQTNKTIILSHPVDAIPEDADKSNLSNTRYELSKALQTFDSHLKKTGITEIVIPIIDRKKNLRFISEAEHIKLLHLTIETTLTTDGEHKTVKAKYYDSKSDFNNLIFPSTAQEAIVKKHFGKNVDWNNENINIQSQFNSSDCGEIVSLWCHELVQGRDISKTALSEDTIKLIWIEATLNAVLKEAEETKAVDGINETVGALDVDDNDFDDTAMAQVQHLDAQKIKVLYDAIKTKDDSYFLKSPAINVVYEILLDKNIDAGGKNQLLADTYKIFKKEASQDEIITFIAKTKDYKKDVSSHWSVKLCNAVLVLVGLALLGLVIAAAIPSAGLSLAVFAGTMKLFYATLVISTTTGIASTGISTCISYHRSSQNIAHAAKELADTALVQGHHI